MFDFLKRKAFEKIMKREAQKVVDALRQLPHSEQIEVANFVRQFISETDALSGKVRNKDSLAANLLEFTSTLRVASYQWQSVLIHGSHWRNPTWLKFSLAESWASSLSSKFDMACRTEIDRLVRGAIATVGTAPASQSAKILPDELVSFVLRH